MEHAVRPSSPPSAGPTAPVAGAPTGGDGGRKARRVGRWRWPRWLPSPKLVLVVVIVVAFGLLLYRLRSDLTTAWHRLSPAGLPWLLAAVAAEVVSFLCYAAVQRRLLVAGGARLHWRTVIKLTVAATGLTNLVPGGTAPASGWLVTQYRRHDVPLALALWAVLAGGFVAGVSVLLLLLVGAAIADLVAVWEFFGLLAVLTAAAVAGVAGAHHLAAVRAWLARDHRMPGLGVARRVVRNAGSVAQFRATVPGGLQVYALSLANWSLDVIVLATAFLVVDLPVPWRALLFAYATAQVAGSLAPVPGGIGFVEGGMIGAFALAGTPTGDAVVATVIYRLITTFGIAGIGTVVLFFVNRREPVPAVLSGAAASLARLGGGYKGGGNKGASGPEADQRHDATGSGEAAGSEEGPETTDGSGR